MRIYKAIVEFCDGKHSIHRFTREQIASFVYNFRKQSKNVFGDLLLFHVYGEQYIILNYVRKVEFYDELTMDEYLTIDREN